MQILDLQLGAYTFIAKLYKYNEHDVSSAGVVNEKFVILKKYDLIHTVPVISDIFFIEQSVYEEYKEQINTNQDIVCFPIVTDNNVLFSYDYQDFNMEIINLDKEVSYVDDYIPCDVIELYRPHLYHNDNIIIYVNSQINNINFHFFCRQYSKLKIHGNNSFDVNHFHYSEYVNIFIPSIEFLANEMPDEQQNIKFDEFYFNEDDCYFYKLFNTWKMDKDDSNIIITDDKSAILKNYPIHITLFPFSDVNTTTHLYNFVNNLELNNDTFLKKNEFKICAKIGFSDGIKTEKINIITSEDYDPIKTEKYSKAVREEIPSEILEYSVLPGTIAILGLWTFPELTNLTLKEAYQYYNNVQESDYYNIEDDEGNTFLGFECTLEIASDISFRHLIHTNTIQLPFIDDVEICLDDVFYDWKQMPEMIVCRLIYNDLYLGLQYVSNNVAITKEQYKYFINKKSTNILNTYRIDMPIKVNNEIDGFNFIDKINCSIIEANKLELLETEPEIGKTYYTDQYGKSAIVIDKLNKSEFWKNGNMINKLYTQIKNVSIKNTTPKILYQPIFYRVQDLQNISIKSSITQNIGINLADYMTKVEQFMMTISKNTFVEYARNDVYIIFKIDGSLITDTDGEYYIFNQDGEYISLGKYTLS